MGKPCALDLRERIIGFVKQGGSRGGPRNLSRSVPHAPARSAVTATVG